MADIRIGNKNYAFSTDTLLGYSTNEANEYKAVIFDSKRFSSKHRKNKDNILELVPNNTPAIDYELNPNGGLSIQKNNKQLIQETEDFTTSEYSLSGVTLKFADVNSPKNDFRLKSDLDERLMRVTKMSNTSSASSSLKYSIFVNAHFCTFSIFAKRDVSKYLLINVDSPTDRGFAQVNVNLEDGKIENFKNNIDNTPPFVSEYANGWYRVFLPFIGGNGTHTISTLAAKDNSLLGGTNVGDSIFITGANFSRESAAGKSVMLHPYIKCLGVIQSVSQDIITRINNVQYMLPKNTAAPSGGLTWTFKAVFNMLVVGRKISIHQTGATGSSGVDKSFLEFEMISLGSGVFDMRINFNFDGTNVVSSSTFCNKVLNESLKVNQAYHFGVTYANGFLRFSLNGTDANVLNDNSTPATNANVFSPVVSDSGRQYDTLRLCRTNSQDNVMSMSLLDMAVYDDVKTQSQLNFLTLQ